MSSWVFEFVQLSKDEEIACCPRCETSWKLIGGYFRVDSIASHLASHGLTKAVAQVAWAKESAQVGLSGSSFGDNKLVCNQWSQPWKMPPWSNLLY